MEGRFELGDAESKILGVAVGIVEGVVVVDGIPVVGNNDDGQELLGLFVDGRSIVGGGSFKGVVGTVDIATLSSSMEEGVVDPAMLPLVDDEALLLVEDDESRLPPAPSAIPRIMPKTAPITKIETTPIYRSTILLFPWSIAEHTKYE